MDLPALVLSCARLALLLAGLLLPGTALTRALRLPVSLGLSFIASAVIIYAGALILNFTGVLLSLGSLTTVLVVVTVGLLLLKFVVLHGESSAEADRHLVRRSLGGGGSSFTESPPDSISGPLHAPLLAPFTRLGVLAPFLLLFWAIIAFLLIREPLAGPDTQFRWAFLPEQWLRLGNLDFYPPVTAHDFLSYFWAESIPPGVASLHAWAFACGGSFAPSWTIPVTALEFLALHDLAWRLGFRFSGDSAARASAVLVAACPLLAWSTRLAQETGLTAVAALAVAFAFTLRPFRATTTGQFHVLRETGRVDSAIPARWAAAAGIAAALGAITREYGLVFPVLAIVALSVLGASRRAWLAFSAAAFPVALVWPLHTVFRTGNPFYSLNVGGLFPLNPVFAAWVTDNRAVFSASFFTHGWVDAFRWFALAATPAVFGWIVVIAVAGKDRLAAFVAASIAIFLAVWLASVPYTVGGVFYTLRVASPALALGAVAAGIALARVRPLLLGLFLLVTLPFTFLLPQNPLHTPPRDWPAPWRTEPPPLPGGPDEIILAILAQDAPVVVTDSPGFQKLLAPHHLAAIPFWSPQVSWLFDPQTPPLEAARRWRASGLHTVVLSKFPPALAFVNHRARWRAPFFQVRTVAASAGFLVLRIDAPAP